MCKRKKGSKQESRQVKLRCFFFLEAHFGCEHWASYRPGKENMLADALSRDHITEFYSLLPQAAKNPSPVPPTLAELLLDLTLNWTSPHWRALFEATLFELLPAPPPSPMCRPETTTLPSVCSPSYPPCPSPSAQLAFLPPSLPSMA